VHSERYKKFLQESFHSPGELLHDHPLEKKIFETFSQIHFFENMATYQPQLVGTQPLFIDGTESGLDLLCYCQSFNEFQRDVEWHFKHEYRFNLSKGHSRGEDFLMASFETNGILIEVFGQKIPSRQQDAYKHMIVEGRLLYLGGETSVEAVKKAKTSGIKTEPAFGEVFKLPGDAHTTLLELYTAPESQLQHMVRTAGF
jgi:hypothetical protein